MAIPLLPFAEMNICLFSLVGFKGHLSLLDIYFFPWGLLSKWKLARNGCGSAPKPILETWFCILIPICLDSDSSR